MSTGMIIGIVVAVVVVLAVVAALAMVQRRRSHLRERFGPEYDRAVSDRPRRQAERELAQRERRHDRLDIHPLSPTSQERYAQHWALVQEQFVDQPSQSVHEADRLVSALMAERGYPTDGYDQQAADLSVEHAATLDHYRSAHDVMERDDRSRVSTEELRGAMVHYRALFDDLLGPTGHSTSAR